MRCAISKTDTSSAANPLIDFWFQQATTVDDDNTGTVQSILGNPVEASFVINVLLETGKVTQVFAADVDLVNDQIVDPLSGIPQPGHYAAAFAVSAFTDPVEPGARMEIVWSWTMPNGATGTAVREFDVLAYPGTGQITQYGPGWGYCTPSDLRAEGLSRVRCDDRRLLRLISMQSRYVDRVTGRFFEPRYQAQTPSGTGGRAMQFGDPLIALQLVTLGNPVVNTIDPASFRVFNRHITAGMTNPDDRNDPKIEFVHYKDIFGRQRSASIDSPLFGVPFRDLFFPAGVQNVNVTALWGYTDPDGSTIGCTPDLIRHVTKLLVYREASKLGTDDRENARDRWRLTGEGTRDQRYSMQAKTEGPFTGDREIDDILLEFVRPPIISAT